MSDAKITTIQQLETVKPLDDAHRQKAALVFGSLSEIHAALYFGGRKEDAEEVRQIAMRLRHIALTGVEVKP